MRLSKNQQGTFSTGYFLCTWQITVNLDHLPGKYRGPMKQVSNYNANTIQFTTTKGLYEHTLLAED